MANEPEDQMSPPNALALCKPPKCRRDPGKGGRYEAKIIKIKFLQPQRNAGLKREKAKKEFYF